MAKRLFCPPRQRNVGCIKFGQASFELIDEFLIHSNKRNKDNLNNLPKCSGSFKQKRLVEYIFLITEELRLDPLVGYHAIELVQRFMVSHLDDLLASSVPQGATAPESTNFEEAAFDMLKDKFPLIIFSCVQLASKLFLHHHIINSSTAVQFLRSVGHTVSKQTILESELMVFKGLEFKLNVLNPLTYVEILLEVLGHNEPSIPVEHLYHLCHPVLQFITLQRTAIYDTLLKVATQCVCPSQKQREKFVTVTEDCMLLGVGVITVATFIHYVKKWEQVVGELSHITGISRKSISDFAHVTLTHIVSTNFPAV
ncbi:cyclin N-terminal domain-containing protein 1 [Melanotaenia boesemani]|uniref:cyclin N-terminal domain-containing protein 1 n=1 Tax=Melanotaenia boesemani TaxID=1250792 RepID=UPI001C0543B7|nr:cyclin N-terminal domain-containing protein 1 [Melanotaenia boesemani]